MKSIYFQFLFFSIISPFLLIAGGTTSIDILKNDVSPRAISLGGGYVAIADDVYAIYYNPAGLATLISPEVSFSYNSGFEGASSNFLALASPLPIEGFSGLGKGVLAGSVYLTDLGSFDYRYINPDGSIYTHKYSAEKNTIVSIAYGEKASQGESKFKYYNAYLEHYLGIGFKYVKSILLDKYDGSAYAVDAGYKVIEPNLGISFGASILNTMGRIKYIEEKYPLPSILRLGFAYQKPTIMEQKLTSTIEYDRFLNDAKSSFKLGLEYHLQQILNFRLGYKLLEENKGFSFGIGLFSGNFSLDFSSSFLSLYNYSNVSISYKFNNITIPEYKKKKVFKEQKEEVKPSTKPVKKVKTPSPQKQENTGDFFWIY